MWLMRGEIEVKAWMIIPFLLYVSQSKIKKPSKTSGGVVWALHITPWLEIGLNGRSKNVEFSDDRSSPTE